MGPYTAGENGYTGRMAGSDFPPTFGSMQIEKGPGDAMPHLRPSGSAAKHSPQLKELIV